MTEYLYFSDAEPNKFYTYVEFCEKNEQNLLNNISLVETEIKNDKIIYLLFLQQNRDEDKINIDTFKLKLQYYTSFVKCLKSSTRDEKQLNRVNELALNYLIFAENFSNKNYVNIAKNLKLNYEYMKQLLEHTNHF